MSESQKCGYCRMAGHRRPVCPELHATRTRIVNDTIRIRKAVYAMLIKKGMGSGAIVKAEGWSHKYIGTVLDLERAIKEWQFMTYRKIAYSKKVTVDTIEPSEYDYHMVYVPMMRDGASAYARIEMKELTGNTTSYHSKNEFEVLSPSHDEYEVDESIWSENIHINERLELKEERGNRGKWDVCILNPKLTIK